MQLGRETTKDVEVVEPLQVCGQGHRVEKFTGPRLQLPADDKVSRVVGPPDLDAGHGQAMHDLSQGLERKRE